MDEEEKEWLNFMEFIDKFFEEEERPVPTSQKDSRIKQKKQKNNKNIQKWLSSVENNLSKTSNSILVN